MKHTKRICNTLIQRKLFRNSYAIGPFYDSNDKTCTKWNWGCSKNINIAKEVEVLAKKKDDNYVLLPLPQHLQHEDVAFQLVHYMW